MKHAKQGKVIWFNRVKGFGEYANSNGIAVFFTAYDWKSGELLPGALIQLRQTKKNPTGGV